MKNYLIFTALSITLVLAAFSVGCSGTPPDLQAGLGEEISLAIGQKVVVAGEDLSIKFSDVIEDSRCPRNVICIWQGQAVCSLQITFRESVNNLSIVEPGLYEGLSGVTFGDYQLSFHLNPYPESNTEISREDYRLIMVCNLLNVPVETEADVTGFITDIQPIGERDVIGKISVEAYADKIVDKYIITINTETNIFRQDGDSISESTFAALENKQRVKLWFSGPVMESFPMQATAKQVVIIE